MDRSKVYEIIDGERNYQDREWGTIEERPKQVGSWMTLMRTILAEAEQKWSHSRGDHEALNCIRKLTAVGVACMEQHGAPERISFVLPKN